MNLVHRITADKMPALHLCEQVFICADKLLWRAGADKGYGGISVIRIGLLLQV